MVILCSSLNYIVSLFLNFLALKLLFQHKKLSFGGVHSGKWRFRNLIEIERRKLEKAISAKLWKD